MALIPAVITGLIVFLYGAASVVSDAPTGEVCGTFGLSTYMCPRCDRVCPFWQLSDSCTYSKVSFVFDNVGTFVYAILMSLWAVGFVEFWRRHEFKLSCDWDTMEFGGRSEPVRQEYQTKCEEQGIDRINRITRKQERVLPNSAKIPGYLASLGFIIGMIFIIGFIVIGTIMYRVQIDFLLKNTSAKSYSSIIVTVTSAIINLIITVPFTQFYYWFSRKLTNYEYHKYGSAFEDSMTMKLYLFQFAIYYSSLFYIAFFKGRFQEYPSTYGESGANDFREQCEPGGCLLELTIQLATIMIGKQAVGNIIEFGQAFCCASRCCSSKESHVVEPYSQIKDEYELPEVNHEFLFDEYLELVIQFGFVTLFAVAFPLAPLFALLNNIVELRLDAWKFLMKCRRPIAKKASDIGIWNTIILAIAYLSVLTNGVIIAWTSEFIPRLTYSMGYTTTSDLKGYVNWTLSSFPITDYNQTGLMYPYVPNNITYCRYRDFRESTGPKYKVSFTYWHLVAARVAFMVTFDHVIFLIINLLKLMIPKKSVAVKDFLDQQEIEETNARTKPGEALAKWTLAKKLDQSMRILATGFNVSPGLDQTAPS